MNTLTKQFIISAVLLPTAIMPKGNGFILTGSSGAVYVMGMDSIGNMQWDKTIATGTGWTYGKSIQPAANGGYILAGGHPGSGGGWGCIIKTNSSGTMQWFKSTPIHCIRHFSYCLDIYGINSFLDSWTWVIISFII